MLAPKMAKSGVESNVTEGVANGDEYIFITAYERQKHIRIRDVRLGLNPIELLPEKSYEGRHFGVMQSKTTTEVHKSADLPWRYRGFKHIVVPKFSKVEGGIKDVPLVEACASVRQSANQENFAIDHSARDRTGRPSAALQSDIQFRTAVSGRAVWPIGHLADFLGLSWNSVA
jgi:hypothetical protein